MPLRLIQVAAGVCKLARVDAGVKQSRIAAALDADQSTVARFEKGNWPTDLERTVAAYADELDLDQAGMWRQIIEVWNSPDQQRELELESMFRALREEVDGAG